MEHKTPSPPTIIKKMKTFLEVEGKWVQYLNPLVANIGPHNQAQTLMSGRTMPQRKEREQCPQKGLGLAQPRA